MRRALSIGSVLLLAVATSAQQDSFTITHNGWTFNQGGLRLSRTGTGNGSANLMAPATGNQDHMFQNWFWYRTNFDSREYALSNQTLASIGADQALLRYLEPAGGIQDALRIELLYSIFGDNANSGSVEVRVDVKNMTDKTLTLNFFHYFDADINGTAGSDRAEFDPARTIHAWEGDTNIDFISFGDPPAWQIGPFATVRGLLTDTDVDNLNNSGSPFGPGDFTGAFQRTWTIDSQQTVTMLFAKSVNIVPEPASLLALAAGLGLVARRRRR